MNYFSEEEVLETLAPTRRKYIAGSKKAELISSLVGFQMPVSSPSGVDLAGTAHAHVLVTMATHSFSNVGQGYRSPEHDRNEIVSILNEPFTLEDRDGGKVLKHRQWSLMGTGSTKAEACASLREEAEDIADFYLSKPDESLTVEAVAFKQFLKKLLAS